MQNRLDELFRAAREEQPFYTYSDAELLVKSFPGGGFTFPKISTMILGTILITGAAFFLFNQTIEEPSKTIIDTPIPLPKKELKTFEKIEPSFDTGTKRENRIQPFFTEEDSTNYTEYYGGVNPFIAPITEKKQKAESDYITLNEEQLEKLGIRYDPDKELDINIRNGRKQPLFHFNVQFKGEFHFWNFQASDTLREKDVLSGEPSCVLFTEIFDNIDINGMDLPKGGYIIHTGRTILCADYSIHHHYYDIAFKHLKGQLLPVLIERKGEHGTLKFILYLTPTPELIQKLPAGHDPKWYQLPPFDWSEYLSYRQMLFTREQDRLDDLKKGIRKYLSPKNVVTDPQKLLLLGIRYNGHSLKTELLEGINDEYNRKRLLQFKASAFSNQYTYKDSILDFPDAPQPIFVSDSMHRMAILVSVANASDYAKDPLLVSLDMADTLVPVIIPLSPSPTELLRMKFHKNRKFQNNMIFWYRKEDLQRVGFRFD